MKFNFLTIASAALLLSACSTFSEQDWVFWDNHKPMNEATSPDRADITDMPTGYAQNYSQTYAHNHDISTFNNDPSVQIFDLTPPMPNQQSQDVVIYDANIAPQLNIAGTNFDNNSVTIYPVHGSMMDAPQYNDHSHFGATQIFFKHGSSHLGSIDKQKIASAAAQSGMIKVEGFSSQPTQAGSQSVSAHILNLKESMNRSYAVSRELLRKGVPPQNITTLSWGAARATGNASHDRRVDITAGVQ